ncbi:MAG: Flp family type IVb pilin [Clostridia bacterium]|jgi:pilus assembly protein Flp/PilA|nr:Flp family type IVb pilin [Clostridia bacterium]
MDKFIKQLLIEEKGQGMVEYGLIITLISLAAVSVMGTVGERLLEMFTDIGTELQTHLP